LLRLPLIRAYSRKKNALSIEWERTSWKKQVGPGAVFRMLDCGKHFVGNSSPCSSIILGAVLDAGCGI
jgi:hypothetical protein